MPPRPSPCPPDVSVGSMGSHKLLCCMKYLLLYCASIFMTSTAVRPCPRFRFRFRTFLFYHFIVLLAFLFFFPSLSFLFPSSFIELGIFHFASSGNWFCYPSRSLNSVAAFLLLFSLLSSRQIGLEATLYR